VVVKFLLPRIDIKDQHMVAAVEESRAELGPLLFALGEV
jgi:hypothetical protein